MEYWAPFLQTLLWVALIGGIAFRFHKPIQGLLEALTDRIKTGSDVTAGPFSLKAMQSLPASEQAARADKEIREANEVAHTPSLPEPAPTAAPTPTPTPTPTPDPAPPAAPRLPAPTPQFRAKYFQAEDLALRAIQAEFGQPISRQVTSGRDEGFDGAFVYNNRLQIVEVKYLARVPPRGMLRQALRQLQNYIAGNNWSSVDLILVGVVDRAEDIEATRNALLAVASDSRIPTVVRVYSLPELQEKFGVIILDISMESEKEKGG